jgi:TolA-binding protein
VASFQAALAADAAWRQADETLLGLAFAYRQLDRLDEAKATLASLLQEHPNSAALDRAHYRLGECAYAAGDYQRAAAEYQQVLQNWPASTMAPYAANGLGWSQLNLGDYPAVVATLTGLVEKHPESPLVPRARYARALARQQLKEYSPAIEDLEAFLKTKTSGVERSDARYVLGLCQAGLEKPTEAAATFQSILAEDPTYAGSDKVRYELAWAFKGQGQEEAAAQAFGELADKHPESPLAAEGQYHVGEFHYQRASALADEGQAEPAAGEFKQAAVSYLVAMTGSGATELGEKAAHKLGWTQYRLDDFAQAQKSFADQRASYPQGPLAVDAAFMEGECLFKQKKYPEALAAYEQVTTPSDKQFSALALLHGGQAACQLKEWTKGLALLTRCAEEHPDWEQVPEVLYEQGWALQNLDKPDEALPLYEAVTTKTDREVAARARFMIGEIYFARQDHAQAVRNFIKAAYGYGYPHWQAEAHYEAARCFEVLGKKKQAIDSYREVVEKHPTSDKVPLAKERLAALGG